MLCERDERKGEREEADRQKETKTETLREKIEHVCLISSQVLKAAYHANQFSSYYTGRFAVIFIQVGEQIDTLTGKHRRL